MRRPTQEQLKKKNDILAIARIKGCIAKEDIKSAVDIAEKRKFTPEQFGKISHMTELSSEEIYKSVFL